MARQPYALIYSPDVDVHLDAIDRKYHSFVREAIEEQLRFEQSHQTRNRKRLRTPAAFAAEWEIRFGPGNRFRVLYRVDEESHIVYVLAIGEKKRGRLLVGGTEIDL